MKENVISKNLLIILIIGLAVALRFYKLGEVPLGVTHDELGYIFNAYSIAQTGKNVFGEHLPIFTWMVRGGFPFLPLPIYTGALFFLFLPLSPFTGRLPGALLGVADVVLVYLLVQRLFKDRPLALLSSFFLAISPWHLHFSRSAYDPNFSLFFYLVAMVVFLYEADKKRFPILSSFAFLFAVFSYRGMSAVFLPLFFLLLWFVVRTYKLKLSAVLLRIAGIVVVTLLFVFAIMSFGSSYTQEALFYKDPKIQENVDKEIREAEGPLFIRRLFLNKPTYIIAKLRENYLRSYSPEYLFLYTEPNRIYSIWTRGRIYFLDIFFILIGSVLLFLRKRNAALVIIGSVLLGGIPGLLGGMPYSARNFFISAFLPVLTAGGVLAVIRYFHSRSAKIILCILISLLYLYSFGSYLFDYYGRYAHQGAESWAKSLKDVSFLVGSRLNDFDHVIIGNTSFGDVVQYALYNNVSSLAVQEAWKTRTVNKSGREEYKLGFVAFKPDCSSFEGNGKIRTPSVKGKSELIVVRGSCITGFDPVQKINDYYGNTVWKIFILE